MTKYRKVPIEELFVDVLRQRALDRKWAQEMADNYNPRLLEPLVGSDRGNGKIAVVKGQHRLEMARIREMKWLPVMVHEGLTLDEEVILHDDLQSKQKKEGALDQFLIQRSAPRIYPVTAAIDQAVIDAGFKVGLDSWDSRTIKAVASLRRLYKRNDDAPERVSVIKDALFVCEAWVPEYEKPMNGTLIEGVGIYLLTAKSKDREAVRAKVGKIAGEVILRRAAGRAQTLGATGGSRALYVATEIDMIMRKRGKQVKT